MTAAGVEALAAYHERRDPVRNVDLGPEHDWSSHAADAFGLMWVAYEEPAVKRERGGRRRVGAGWEADEMAMRDEDQLHREKQQEFLDFETYADGARAASKTHPNVIESMIPVYGSAREAIADWQEGDRVGAVLNGALAASDLIPGAAVGKALLKGTAFYGAKQAAKHTLSKEGAYGWRNVRNWMGKTKQLDKGEHGHHWAFENHTGVPNWIKNQPWNIKGLDAVTHGRIHGPYTMTDKAGVRAKFPEFNTAEKLWHGTPWWVKHQAGTLAGKAGGVAKRVGDEDDE